MTMLYYVLLVVMANYPVNIVERPKDVLSCVLVLILMFFNYAVIFFCTLQTAAALSQAAE